MIVSNTADAVTVANPATSLTIDAGSAADKVNVFGFGTGYTASTTITSLAATPLDTLDWAAWLAPAANNSVSLTAYTINVSNAASIAVTGTGTASLTSFANVYFDPGTSVGVVNGNLTVSANAQSSHTGASFHGVALNGGARSSTGSGNISVTGYSGTSGGNFAALAVQRRHDHLHIHGDRYGLRPVAYGGLHRLRPGDDRFWDQDQQSPRGTSALRPSELRPQPPRAITGCTCSTARSAIHRLGHDHDYGDRPGAGPTPCRAMSACT